MNDTNTLFFSGHPAKMKILMLGPDDSFPEPVRTRLRSLNIEHVSPSGLMRREISRRTPPGPQAGRAARRGSTPAGEKTTLALMRRWFWTRKPDAGFALGDFPATLLQAKVFDEWLDARDETLSAVLAAPGAAPPPVVEHYRAQGLLVEDEDGAPAA
ncbi:MAG: nucleoside monophosphate kinase [Opitutaceae bacterium]|nr:nucleoside monophosphate kinase [Opitutaceae bacterium]